MKKFAFASVIVTAASLAAAGGAAQPEWNHANDSGAIAGLTEVQYSFPMQAKNDDRIKYTVEPTGVRTPADIGYNDTHARLAVNGSR